MKNLQLITTLFFIAIFLSCSEPNGKGNDSSTENGIVSFFGEDYKAHEFKDAKTGMMVSSVSYPSDWKVLSKPNYKLDNALPVFEYRIQGPDNLKVFNSPLQVFVAAPNARMEQSMRQFGMKNLRTMVSPKDLVQKEIAPRMQAMGFSFVEQRSMPELEKKLKDDLVKGGAKNMESQLIGTVWTNSKGQKGLVVLGYVTKAEKLFDGQTAYNWMYATDYLTVDKAGFEEAIAHLTRANLDLEINPQWESYKSNLIAKRNDEARRRDQLAMQRSATAHQNRMAQQQASFNAHQNKMKGISAAQDASHASFMNRNFGTGSNTTQTNAVNTIWEQETVYNPGDGKNYQIDAGAKEYWMDSDGNQIKSDDLFYNPNGDMNLNQGEWSKVWDDDY